MRVPRYSDCKGTQLPRWWLWTDQLTAFFSLPPHLRLQHFNDSVVVPELQKLCATLMTLSSIELKLADKLRRDAAVSAAALSPAASRPDRHPPFSLYEPVAPPPPPPPSPPPPTLDVPALLMVPT
jgi:hypothetical protein